MIDEYIDMENLDKKERCSSPSRESAQSSKKPSVVAHMRHCLKEREEWRGDGE